MKNLLDRLHFIFTVVAFSTLCLSQSIAAPITANVIGPKIGEKGQSGIEYRSGYEWDNDNKAQDGAFTDRVDFFYNISNSIKLLTFVNRVDPGNDDSEITNVFIEPGFQFFNKQEDGFDGAIMTGVSIATQDEHPNLARIVLTGEAPYHGWALRHNSIFAHEFGGFQTSGVQYQARWRATYKLGSGPSVGVEMFNDFGNLRTTHGFDSQQHRAGPVMTGEITDGLGYQTGALAGLSDNAPDFAVKFWLSYRF